MAITSVDSSYTTTSTTSDKKLGKEAFLHILCTQLKYQNPLEPQDPAEFLTQLSQMTQVEQLTNISKSMESLTTSVDTSGLISTIGKKVGVESDVLSKGDEVTITPASDYDKVVMTVKNLKDGATDTVTFNKGDDLTYTNTSDDMVGISVTASLNGKAVGYGATVFKEVTGIKVIDTGSVLTFANDETYDARKVTIIKK
ncbi:flagellar hook assembly protein FlgD [Syntrophorhabdus aromaticivorans]|uniref:flagellar hook assembly protein FlgD n=1 Tax=Syntrophorhabdus aromaticivorans TaxID=328301 RepID=UPI0003FB240F|nr:flagellar hook capping FlgD N-terminal domain-containing protein [Syntrophorhabdus aromaticivorans]